MPGPWTSSAGRLVLVALGPSARSARRGRCRQECRRRPRTRRRRRSCRRCWGSWARGPPGSWAPDRRRPGPGSRCPASSRAGARPHPTARPSAANSHGQRRDFFSRAALRLTCLAVAAAFFSNSRCFLAAVLRAFLACLAGLARRLLRGGDELGPAGVELAAGAVDARDQRLPRALQRRGRPPRGRRSPAAWRRRRRRPGRPPGGGRRRPSAPSRPPSARPRPVGRGRRRRATAASRAASTRGAAASRAASTRGRDAPRRPPPPAGRWRRAPMCHRREPRRRRPRRPSVRPPSGRRRAWGRRPSERPRPGGRAARPRDGRPRWPPPRCGRSPPGVRRR